MPPPVECIEAEQKEKKGILEKIKGGSYGSLTRFGLVIWTRMKVLILFERFDFFN